jgi:hypothetical protein
MDTYCIAYKDESNIYGSHSMLKNWTDESCFGFLAPPSKYETLIKLFMQEKVFVLFVCVCLFQM